MKMYNINIERKKLLKQRREKTIQNTKDRERVKENLMAASKAGHKANRPSNNTKRSAHTHDEFENIDDIDITTENTNIIVMDAEKKYRQN